MNWKEAVSKLAQQVEAWVSDAYARKGHMPVHEMTMDPTPDEPLLEIIIDGGRDVLRLEPAYFAADHLPTKVHLYSYPTLRRVILFGPTVDGSWQVQSDQGVDMRYPWTKEGFLDLLKALEPDVPQRIRSA